MTIIGVDYSMTCPAVAVLGETFLESAAYFLTDRFRLVGKFGNVTGSQHKAWKSNEQRYEQIADWAIAIINGCKEPNVFIEDYSMGSVGKTFSIAENTEVLKFKLYKHGIPFLTIPPTVIKKSFTGKGNADKTMMVEKFTETTGIDLGKRLTPDKKIGSPVTDIVDAFAIAKYGLTYLQKSDRMYL